MEGNLRHSAHECFKRHMYETDGSVCRASVLTYIALCKYYVIQNCDSEGISRQN